MRTDVDGLEDADVELPPSAKFVEFVLTRKGAMTKAELVDETSLHPRTVRRALDRLEEAGRLVEQPCHTDGRQRLFDVE